MPMRMVSDKNGLWVTLADGTSMSWDMPGFMNFIGYSFHLSIENNADAVSYYKNGETRTVNYSEWAEAYNDDWDDYDDWRER